MEGHEKTKAAAGSAPEHADYVPLAQEFHQPTPAQNAMDSQQGYCNQTSSPQVIITQPGTTYIARDAELQHLEEINSHMMKFACFVALCCNLLFGCIGLCLGFMAQDEMRQGSKESGRRMTKAGWIVSGVGIPIGIAVAIVIWYFRFSNKQHTNYP